MTAEDTVRSSFGRPLKSSEPDLEIVVGKEKEVLHYHSVIMASYSEYIDTMLSTPMKEQDTKTLSFPDIQPREWKKMIAFLEPGGNRNMNLQDFANFFHSLTSTVFRRQWNCVITSLLISLQITQRRQHWKMNQW